MHSFLRNYSIYQVFKKRNNEINFSMIYGIVASFFWSLWLNNKLISNSFHNNEKNIDDK